MQLSRSIRVKYGMKRLILSSILLTLSLIAAAAQSPFAGWWRGQLAMLPIVFQIEECADGTINGNLYSPAQTADPIPLTAVKISGDTITLEAASLGLHYRGTINRAPRKISGTLTQGSNFPLALFPATKEDAKVYRPQTPQPPYLYNSQDITFRNDTLTLAGTLTTPWTSAPAGAVVLVSGSGLQNRDEELWGHRPFAVIADFLTRCGWTVLRYDDRGVGGSDAGSPHDTTADFATDALAAIDYLRKLPALADAPIGILGHSEGGAIAIINAATHPDKVDFIISLAGPAVKGVDVMVRQNEMLAELSGAEITPGRRDTLRHAFSLLADTTLADTELEPRLMTALNDIQPDSATRAASIRQIITPWYRAFMAYDPAPYLKLIRCPMLALNGIWDAQVDASQNLKAIEAAVPQAKIIAYPALNHMFQEAPSRSQSISYGSIQQTIAPAVLNDIANFLLTLTRTQ